MGHNVQHNAEVARPSGLQETFNAPLDHRSSRRCPPPGYTIWVAHPCFPTSVLIRATEWPVDIGIERRIDAAMNGIAIE